MRLTDKDKIRELEILQRHKVIMTDKDYKELKLGLLENLMEKYNCKTISIINSYTITPKRILNINVILIL